MGSTESTNQPARGKANANKRLYDTLVRLKGTEGANMTAVLPHTLQVNGDYGSLLIRMINSAEREIKEFTPQDSHAFLLKPFPKLREWVGPNYFVQPWNFVRQNVFTDSEMTALSYTAHIIETSSPEVTLIEPELEELLTLVQALVEEVEVLDVPPATKEGLFRRSGDLQQAIRDYKYLGPDSISQAAEGVVGVFFYNVDVIKDAEAKPQEIALEQNAIFSQAS
jgi:hypothetical protein